MYEKRRNVIDGAVTSIKQQKQLDGILENDNIYEHNQEADDFLKEDIRINGGLNPIIIIKSDTNAKWYTIVLGHRRTKIAKDLGFTEFEATEILTLWNWSFE